MVIIERVVGDVTVLDLSGPLTFGEATDGIVRLRVQVAQWADEQPGTELSRLPIPV